MIPTGINTKYNTDYRKYIGAIEIIGSTWRVYHEAGHSDLNTSTGAVTHLYYVRDYLGSTRAVIDESGNVLQSTAYYPSGVPLTPNTLTPQTIKLHTGKDYFDLQGAGWYDNNARYYDCLLPTFKSQDPLAETTPWISPYAHCSNNPLNRIDPTGLFDSEEDAKDWAKANNINVGLFRDHRIMKDDENAWAVVNAKEGIMYNRDKSLIGLDNVIGLRPDGVTKSVVSFSTPYNQFETFISDCWNSPIARNIIPDFVSVGVGFSGIAGVGASTSFELNWLVRGSEASWSPIISATQTVGGGFSVDATINIGGTNYLGETYNIERNMIQTSIGNCQIGGFISGGVSAGGKIGLTGGLSSSDYSTLISRQLNLGLGLPCGPLPANVAIGGSNTFILKDFAK